MNFRSVAAVTLAFGMAACNEIVTSPEQSGVRAPTYGFSVDNPPPPPADLDAVGEVMFGSEGAFRTASSASAVSPAVTPSGITFPLNVTYFFNKPGNSGWLVLPEEQGSGVEGSGRVKFRDGVFLGDGRVEVTLGTGVLAFDLTNVSPDSQFASCTISAPEVGSGQSARPEGGCFYVEINDATLNRGNGPEAVSVAIRLPCVPSSSGDPHHACVPPEVGQ